MHFRKTSHGKGTGAMTELDKDLVGETDILSNRDKKLHTEERGQDGNAIKTEREQNHAANRRP